MLELTFFPIIYLFQTGRVGRVHPVDRTLHLFRDIWIFILYDLSGNKSKYIRAIESTYVRE